MPLTKIKFAERVSVPSRLSRKRDRSEVSPACRCARLSKPSIDRSDEARAGCCPLRRHQCLLFLSSTPLTVWKIGGAQCRKKLSPMRVCVCVCGASCARGVCANKRYTPQEFVEFQGSSCAGRNAATRYRSIDRSRSNEPDETLSQLRRRGRLFSRSEKKEAPGIARWYHVGNAWQTRDARPGFTWRREANASSEEGRRTVS